MGRSSAVTLALLLLAFDTQPASARSIPFANAAVILGQGYDSFAGELRSPILGGQGAARQARGMSKTVYSYLADYRSDAYRRLDVEAQLGFGAFKVAGAMSQVAATSFASKTSTFEGHVVVTTRDSIIVINPKLTGTINMSPTEFAKRYGNEFVRAIHYGGLLSVKMHVESKSASSRREFEAKARAEGWGNQASVSLAQLRSEVSSEQTVRFEVSSFGADNNWSAGKTLTGFDDFDQYINAFVGSVQGEGGHPVAVELEPIWNLDGVPNGVAKLAPLATEVSERYVATSLWEHRAKEIVASPTGYPCRPSDFDAAIDAIASYNATLRTSIDNRQLLFDAKRLNTIQVPRVPSLPMNEGWPINVRTGAWQEIPEFNPTKPALVCIAGAWDAGGGNQFDPHRDWYRIRFQDVFSGMLSDPQTITGSVILPANHRLLVKLIDSSPNTNDETQVASGNYLDNAWDPMNEPRVIFWSTPVLKWEVSAPVR